MATPTAFEHLGVAVPAHFDTDGVTGSDILYGRTARTRARQGALDSPSLFDAIGEDDSCPEGGLHKE
jgi:hypothetical protein